ncbi:MAG: hypothetical protein GY854_21605 [Deltaproteobacteria bacterium]|nr:hypothetical protein [Deltaproteobacteria bacterium]
MLAVAAFVAAGCGGARSDANVQKDGTATEGGPFILIDAAEDQRTLDPRLAELAGWSDVEVRERLAVALGRIGDPKSAPILLELLDDDEPAVRDAAVFSCGLLRDNIPDNLRAAIVARLEKEDRIEGFVAILDAIGRVGGEEVASRLISFCEDERPEVRAAAIRALGILGQRGLPIPDGIVEKIATHLDDKYEPVRFMSAFALYRIAKPLPGPAAAVVALEKAARDESAEVRAYAMRALARRGGLVESTISKALDDADARVGATAVSAIGFVAEEKRCVLAAHALGVVAARVEKDPSVVRGVFVHTARAALEGAADCMKTAQILDQAGRIAAAIKVPEEPGSAGAARVLCLARLVAGADDLALLSCDPERPHVEKLTVIRRLKRGGAKPDQDAKTLAEMVADSDLRVAIAAVSALAGMAQSRAKKTVLEALDDQRDLVVAAALDAIAMSPDNYRPKSDETALKDQVSVIEKIGDVVERFEPFEHVYAPIISAVFALKALGDPAADPILRRLAVDPRPAIRGVVLDAYDAIDGIEAPAGLPNLVPVRPISHGKKNDQRSSQTEATVWTTRGAFTVSLDGNVAPATVSSFVALANSGYFEDSEIHRVVPNFVVQAGDPTGTGLGDPGYALRCEVSPALYERGTVGMALSGKDTGGSQFFVALSRQPHLDGNYTVFGKVTQGMEIVDLIEEGDQIIRVSIKTE